MIYSDEVRNDANAQTLTRMERAEEFLAAIEEIKANAREHRGGKLSDTQANAIAGLEAKAEEARAAAERSYAAQQIQARSGELQAITGTPNGAASRGTDEAFREELRSNGTASLTFAGEARDLTTANQTVEVSYPGTVRSILTERIPYLGLNGRGPTIIVDSTARDIVIPTVTADGSATLIAEAGAYQESDSTTSSITLESYKYGKLIQITDEVQRSGVGLDQIVVPSGVRSVSAAVTAALVNGDGSSKPHGLHAAATSGVTATGTTAITADEVLELYHSVSPEYRASASCAWSMSDTTWFALRALKDQDDRYLVGPQGGLQDGERPTLFGKPVVLVSDAPALEASAKPIVFGDMSAFFIRVGKNLLVEVSEHYAFNAGLWTYRITLETDSALADTGAVKALTMAAS